MQHDDGESATARAPRDVYRERAARFDGEAAALGGGVRLYGRLRLVFFAAAFVGAWWLFLAGRGAAAWALLGASAVAFTALVARHRAARRRQLCAQLMGDCNREGVARIARQWDALLPTPDAAPGIAPRNHDYAADLDLYGRASLLHLIGGVCGTAPGRRTLQAWLLRAADPDTVAMRQEAVREMANAIDFRDRLAAEARLMARHTKSATGSESTADSEPFAAAFLRWAEGERWRPRLPWLRAFSFVLPPVNVAAIVLYALGVAPTPVLAWPLLISALVLAPSWRSIHQAFAAADDGESGVRRYGPLLDHVRRTVPRSRCLDAIRERIGTGPRAAPEEIATLRRLLDMADLRRSPLFHIPIAALLHWDVHVMAALDRWKSRSGAHVRDWLDAVGETEALAALAALTADHPDWATPVLDPAIGILEARAIGHPLLSPAICVRNDVEIGPAGSFLLVTGSNMSGKSTLLRAIGLNSVLAHAGGPVCAAELRTPLVRVITSIRVEDSLAAGVSYFMAGLQRLKRVVDAAHSRGEPHARGDLHSGADPTGSPAPRQEASRTLYLLDEILQGTNSAERRIAARTVLRQLLDADAIGAVTTHDLSLADTEDLVARAVAVHFTESVDDEADAGIAFDYRLRQGVATSTNALKLLKMVGLGEPPAERHA